MKENVHEQEKAPETSVHEIIKSLEADGVMPEEIATSAEFILKDGARKLKNRQIVINKAQVMVEKPSAEEQTEEKPKPESDWLNRLFGIVDDISDEDMQGMWAQILAGEINNPKSYSIKTIDVLRNMSKEDARLYVDAMKYQCFDDFIISEKEYGLDLNTKIILTDIGLVSSEDITRTITFCNDSHFRILKKGFCINLDCDNNELSVIFKGRRLTKAGYELLQLLDPVTNHELFDYIGNNIIKGGAKTVAIHRIIRTDGDSVSYVTTPEKFYSKDDSQSS